MKAKNTRSAQNTGRADRGATGRQEKVEIEGQVTAMHDLIKACTMLENTYYHFNCVGYDTLAYNLI